MRVPAVRSQAKNTADKVRTKCGQSADKWRKFYIVRYEREKSFFLMYFLPFPGPLFPACLPTSPPLAPHPGAVPLLHVHAHCWKRAHEGPPPAPPTAAAHGACVCTGYLLAHVHGCERIPGGKCRTERSQRCFACGSGAVVPLWITFLAKLRKKQANAHRPQTRMDA